MKTLKVYMAEKNIGNAQAVKETGCSASSICLWRNGKSMPDPANMGKLKDWSDGELNEVSFLHPCIERQGHAVLDFGVYKFGKDNQDNIAFLEDMKYRCDEMISYFKSK